MPSTPLREELIRAKDRARVQVARSSKQPVWLFALLAGPGILVMLGENDGPSMLSYAATGASFGVGFFVPFILLQSTSKLPASVAIYQFFSQYGQTDYGQLAAFSILYTLPVVMLWIVMSRFLRGNFTFAGAVKG